MPERNYTDQDIRNVEAKRLLSEIERNKAECEELASRRAGSWKPYILGAGVLIAMFATFADFFSNLYQIAVTDREALRLANAQLVKAQAALEERLRLADQSAIAGAALVTSSELTTEVKESTLYGAILVTRWGRDLQEAHAVRFDPINTINDKSLFAHGAQLGIGKPDSDLGVGGGQDWSGKWTVEGGKIRITETYPRPFNGIVIELDSTKRAPNGRYPVTRTRGLIVETGVGEILFSSAKSR